MNQLKTTENFAVTELEGPRHLEENFKEHTYWSCYGLWKDCVSKVIDRQGDNNL